MNKPRESLRAIGTAGLIIGILIIIVAAIAAGVGANGTPPDAQVEAGGLLWVGFGIDVAGAGFLAMLFYLLAGSIAHSLKLLRVAVLSGEDVGGAVTAHPPPETPVASDDDN